MTTSTPFPFIPAACLLLAALATTALADPAAIALKDTGGKKGSSPLDCSDASHKAAVLIFTTTDCPIANSYSPEITRIAAEYGRRGVRFTLVHIDHELANDAAARHASEYRLDDQTAGITVVVDRRHQLVKLAGATMTPEVALYTANGKLAYLGRIDDLYAGYGDKRAAPSQHNLRDALDAVLAGKKVKVPRAEAIGCYIPDLD